MRKASVYFSGRLCTHLEETDRGYRFSYVSAWFDDPALPPASLTVNGKKKNLRKKDFLSLTDALHVPQQVYPSLLRRLKDGMPKAMELIQSSLLSEGLKGKFLLMIKERIARLEGDE